MRSAESGGEMPGRRFSIENAVDAPIRGWAATPARATTPGAMTFAMSDLDEVSPGSLPAGSQIRVVACSVLPAASP